LQAEHALQLVKLEAKISANRTNNYAALPLAA